MKTPIPERIDTLKRERNAVILAHNYQVDEVQDLADYVGDSLGLARRAAATKADVIVFCGVYFMAETAYIVNPGRTVLLPDLGAGCPMARMIDARKVHEMRREHPDAVVVCYVNSTAEVKAASDYCCTSSNAVQVVESIDPDRSIIFVPDRHLGNWVAAQTGRRIITHMGYCPTHVRITPEALSQLKRTHPDAEVMVHPECPAETVALADVVTSTSGMLEHARQTDAREIIVGTEVGLIHRLEQENPDKTFVAATPAAVCPNMKRITVEKVLWSLEEMKHSVVVPEPTCTDARRALDRMLAVTGVGETVKAGT